MKRYLISVTKFGSIEVEAENGREAIDKAWDSIQEVDWDDHDLDVTGILDEWEEEEN